uniref:Sjogren syndrome nuclear autoantigen 1 n=1 Tax=Monopterus albus TaxID=43700 RepID=A0A3Q3K6L5_MONAL
MTQQAAALQTYNNELVKCIEDLCSKRDELNRQIKQEEEEKERLQHDISVLSEKLNRVNESLAQRQAARATFNRTIKETEAAYSKVCVSTVPQQPLLKYLLKFLDHFNPLILLKHGIGESFLF